MEQSPLHPRFIDLMQTIHLFSLHNVPLGKRDLKTKDAPITDMLKKPFDHGSLDYIDLPVPQIMICHQFAAPDIDIPTAINTMNQSQLSGNKSWITFENARIFETLTELLTQIMNTVELNYFQNHPNCPQTMWIDRFPPGIFDLISAVHGTFGR